VTRGGSAALVIVAVGVFLGCWTLLHHGTLARAQLTDTGTYSGYGDQIARGAVPYRDFRLEYPPGALPMFVLPALGHEGDQPAFDRWFGRLMALCGSLAIVGAALALRALGAGAMRSTAALGLMAVSPLLLGSVVLTRFDLWPVALVAFAVAALFWERFAAAAVLLGLAIAAKLWPAVLAPLAIIWIARTRGARAAAAWTAGVVAVDAACFLPFAVLSPAGLGASFHAQLARPLQLESLGGAVLIAVHHVFGTGLRVVSSFGSQNPSGGGVHVLGIASTVATVVSVVAVWALFARGPATVERLAAYSAAAVAALLAFGKVFSPQYLLWLVALVPLVRGRRGLVAGGVYAVALGLTQSWFPRHYWALAIRLAPTQSWLLLARDLAVVALLGVLAWPATERASSGDGRARLAALERMR
jgi:Glycosyltransferase family 87